MAGTEIQDLATEITDPADGDMLVMVSDPLGTPVTKKAQYKNVVKVPHGLIYGNTIAASGIQLFSHGATGDLTSGSTGDWFTASGPSYDVTCTPASARITPLRTGIYRVGAQLTVVMLPATGGTVLSSTHTFSIRYNGSIVNGTQQSVPLGTEAFVVSGAAAAPAVGVYPPNSGVPQSVNIGGLVDVTTAGQHITLAVTVDIAVGTETAIWYILSRCNLWCHRVGPT